MSDEAKFDIVDPAMRGYKIVWEQRQYLFRLAMIPLLVKFICISLVTAYGWDTEFIKRVFIMLPSYFADGWMLSHLVRLIYFDQKWPFRPTGDAKKDMLKLQDRARGIMAGTLMFVVIRYLFDGLVGAAQSYTMAAEQQMAAATPVETNPLAFFLALAMFLALIWGFRLIWLYIPAALNLSISAFMRATKRFSLSFYIIGIWLICLMPTFFVLGVTASALLGEDMTAVSAGTLILFNMMRTAADTLIALLATAGVAYGFKTFIKTQVN